MSFSEFVGALRVVKEGRGDLSLVPEMFWDSNRFGVDFLLELTRFHWSAISFMPTEAVTQDIALEAVLQNPSALEFVPIGMRSYELCSIAIEKNFNALNSIPEDFIQSFLEISLGRISNRPSVWNEVPEKYKTHQYMIDAVEANPHVIEFLPVKMQTQDVCEAFLYGSSEVFLEDVKVEARSRTLCIACLRAGRGPIDAVPRLLWGPDIIEADRAGQQLNSKWEDFRWQ